VLNRNRRSSGFAVRAPGPEKPQLIFQQAQATAAAAGPKPLSYFLLNMRRRQFVQTAPAAVAFALVGCGGGGGGGDGAALDPLSEDLIDDGTGRKIPRPASSTGSVSGTGYPFGSRKDAYVPGTITPTNRTNAQMDAELKAKYDAWKRALVVSVPTVPGGLAIRFHPDQYLTVSEAMGYGLLLSVLFAGHDPGAKALFDGLLTTVRARPARGSIIHYGPWGKDLMDWRLAMDGRSSDANNVGWNAMDGDLDIAMALLMADRQWGSAGQWNYLQEGKNTIHAIKMQNMKEDGTTKGLPNANNNRTSDYMTGHFRAFKKATGDTIWDRAIDRAYQLVDRMQTVYSPGVGLMPDFIVNTHTATPSPSPGFIGDYVDTEMFYFANAQRNPWRWGTDFITSGDVRWKNVCNKMTDFFKRDTGGDPAKTATGYNLNGTLSHRALFRPYLSSWYPKGMVGPMLCGAMVDPAHQAFLNSLWDLNNRIWEPKYYDAELQLLPMVVASGNWWNPTPR